MSIEIDGIANEVRKVLTRMQDVANDEELTDEEVKTITKDLLDSFLAIYNRDVIGYAEKLLRERTEDGRND